MEINVLVDIYKNYFPNNSEFKSTNNHVYGNIRAVDLKEKLLVEQCIELMYQDNSPFLFPRDTIIFNEIKPIETDRVCILDIENKVFKF